METYAQQLAREEEFKRKINGFKPGDKLVWSAGYTAKSFAHVFGETVEFIELTGEDDMRGLPILRVKIPLKGDYTFSSFYFQV
ncbi:hypothetical protein D4R52_03860 [bacterium]|nr:MAG: hypothetical protein D4R52_03860 [bacterium]